ncbi:MAG: hypothetical protein H7Y59_15070 [Anaerolineales bacterium]|nr:hypothetical protein [Anaerolineales bacterium]
MDNKHASRVRLWLITGLVILGCVFPSVAAPATIQTPISQSSDQLGTSIVQTAEAAQTKTALVLPTSTLTPTITFTPTITPTSTPTFIFSLLSTATPIPTETAIVPISAGGSGNGNENKDDEDSVFTDKEWTCLVTAKYPGKGAVIKQEQTITAYWTLLNTGTKTWTNNGVDFIYRGGFRMDGRRIQDLPFTLAPGNEITLKIQLTTPNRSGTYSTIWTLKVGRRSFCPMKITFDVAE